MNQGCEPALAISKRESNKRDRLNRIIKAADEIFSARGYDEATTREIAERAEVSVGTLFLHARDKRELLMMIVNRYIEDIEGENLLKLTPDKPFLDQLMHVLTRRYQFWATHPELANATFREIYRLRENSGPEGTKFLDDINKLSASLADLLRQVIAKNSNNTQAAPEIVVEVCIDIYMAEISKWLQGQHLDIYVGSARLRERLQLVLHGVDVE